MALGQPDAQGPNDPKSGIGVRLLVTIAGVVLMVLLLFLLGSGNDYTFGR